MPRTVLDAHFIFILVLGGAFDKKLNSGAQLNEFPVCKNCSLHLTLKSVLAGFLSVLFV